MPSKLDDTSSMHFLYACLEATHPSRVDFQKVAKKFNIRVPAARMRLRRLQEALDGKQNSRVSKTRSTVPNRGKQRGEKKTAKKEGLETNWKGMEEDDDDDDDDDEEMLVRKSEDLSGKLRKEENDDDNAWKLLPEAALPGAFTDVQTLESAVSHHGHALSHYGHAEPMLPLDPMMQQNVAQTQAQMLLDHAPNVDLTKREAGQLPPAYTYSSAYNTMPQAYYNQAHSPNSQPDNAYYPSPWRADNQQ